MPASPELSVVCKSCGSEVSPYVTECPYCGSRLRKRAPRIDILCGTSVGAINACYLAAHLDDPTLGMRRLAIGRLALVTHPSVDAMALIRAMNSSGPIGSHSGRW